METLILVILLAILAGEIATIIVKAPILRITLGNIGDPWVRAPQNTALAITKDRKLILIIIAVPAEKLEIFKNKFSDQIENKKYIIISDDRKGGLYFIGFSVVGYEVYEWYETEEDEKDGVNALHSIDLAEQVIKYLPQEPQKKKEGEKIVPVEGSKSDVTYGVPSFKSADNIEVRTSLTIFFIVVDPEKALFNVRYRKRAIQEQIFPLWRDVIGAFSFFAYDNKNQDEEKEVQISQEIRTESNNALRKKFGLTEEEINEEEKRDPEKVATKLFEEEWGMWVRDITVGELEAADPEIEDALGAQMKARTKALAEIESAKGDEIAFEKRGIGKEKYIQKIIKGFAGENKELISEAIRAAVEWRQFEALEKMPKEGKYLYQWPQTSNSTDGLANLLKNLDAGTLATILQAIKK